MIFSNASSKVWVSVSSVNSSSENFNTSANATACITVCFMSSKLDQRDSRKLGSKEKNPPVALMRRMASKVVSREGLLIKAMEQQCSHSFAWKFGKSATCKNWSALGFTIKVKLRSPLSNPTTTVEVRCCGSRIMWLVCTFSCCRVCCINSPKGSLPTRPINALSPPKRAMPTATFAGAPPAQRK